MRIWPILLIKSDLKCCIHLSRSLLYLGRECHCWWWYIVDLTPIADLPPGRSAMILKNHCRPYPIADLLRYHFNRYRFIFIYSYYLSQFCGKYSSFTQLKIKVLSLNVNCMYTLLLWLKILISIYPKMRIRNFTKIGEGLQCCRSSPGEDLQWKGEDLQCCKPSPLGEGMQCCRSSGGRSAMLQIFRGEGLQCCRPSGGKVCKGEGLQYNSGPVTPRGLM